MRVCVDACVLIEMAICNYASCQGVIWVKDDGRVGGKLHLVSEKQM